MKAAVLKKSTRKRVPQKRTETAAPTGWQWHKSAGAQVLLAAPLTRQPWLAHGFSTRLAGKSSLHGGRALNLGFTEWDSRRAVEANRKAFVSALGASAMKLVGLHQIHSDVIHRVDKMPFETPRGDALITKTAGLLLTIQTADCVPVLLADVRGRAIAAIHAGWRGTLARIVAKTLGRMRMEFGTQPADVLAAIGPAIGQCSFEVGPEVAQAFATQFPDAQAWFEGKFEQIASAGDEPNPLKWLSMTPPGHDPPPPRVQLDLIAANRWQLTDSGVPAENIVAANLCTACHTDLFFSYRREQGRTGRMMAAIGIRR
jgi:YfiH family protein